MRNMSVEFVEPLRSVLEYIVILSFNFDVIQTEFERETYRNLQI